MDEKDPKRRVGRPRTSPEPMSRVSSAVPVSMHDRLIQQATKRDMSLSEVIRRLLYSRLP